jgi:uncharacterized protein YndB with AHSA1/START domain
LLDSWGAKGRTFREISDWLAGDHGLSRWWAQKIIVEYEQSRGVRKPGARPDGTFEITATKTIGVGKSRAFDAFIDPRQRRKWLSASMTVRDSQQDRSMSFTWKENSSRVNVSFLTKGRSKTMVAVSHAKLASAKEAADMKAMWRDGLSNLKALLERSPTRPTRPRS